MSDCTTRRCRWSFFNIAHACLLRLAPFSPLYLSGGTAGRVRSCRVGVVNSVRSLAHGADCAALVSVATGASTAAFVVIVVIMPVAVIALRRRRTRLA